MAWVEEIYYDPRKNSNAGSQSGCNERSITKVNQSYGCLRR
jgi:hypothetical protein